MSINSIKIKYQINLFICLFFMLYHDSSESFKISLDFALVILEFLKVENSLRENTISHL